MAEVAMKTDVSTDSSENIKTGGRHEEVTELKPIDGDSVGGDHHAKSAYDEHLGFHGEICHLDRLTDQSAFEVRVTSVNESFQVEVRERNT